MALTCCHPTARKSNKIRGKKKKNWLKFDFLFQTFLPYLFVSHLKKSVCLLPWPV
jgi:hypothetical protein